MRPCLVHCRDSLGSRGTRPQLQPVRRTEVTSGDGPSTRREGNPPAGCVGTDPRRDGNLPVGGDSERFSSREGNLQARHAEDQFSMITVERRMLCPNLPEDDPAWLKILESLYAEWSPDKRWLVPRIYEKYEGMRLRVFLCP